VEVQPGLVAQRLPRLVVRVEKQRVEMERLGPSRLAAAELAGRAAGAEAGRTQEGVQPARAEVRET
jgi:hypothetical protein